MSVLICGVQYPNKPLTLIIYPDGTASSVYDNQRGTAVPVPPHGRLIDSDALEAKGYCLSKLNIDYDAPSGSMVWRECVPFDEAPTIIQASEEGE